MSKPLLILSSKPETFTPLTDELNSLGVACKGVNSPEEAIDLAASGEFGLLIAERTGSFDEDRKFLEELRKKTTTLPVYLTGERFKMAENIRAVRLGVRGVWSLPLDLPEILPKISGLLGLKTPSTKEPPKPAKTSTGLRLGGAEKNTGNKTFSLPKKALKTKTENEEHTEESARQPQEDPPAEDSPLVNSEEAEDESSTFEPKDLPEEIPVEKGAFRLGKTPGTSMGPAAFGELSDKLRKVEQEKEALREELEAEKQKLGDSLAQSSAFEDKIKKQQTEIAQLQSSLRSTEKKLHAAEEGSSAPELSKEKIQEFENLQKNLQKQQQSLEEEKKFLRQREAYLEECEEKLSEKTTSLDQREAEIQQQIEDFKNEQESLAASAEGEDAEALSKKWLQEKMALQSRISELEKQTRENQTAVTADTGELDDLRRIEAATRHELEELESSLSAEKSARERAEQELAKIQDVLNQTRRKISHNESVKDQIRERLDRLRSLLEDDANPE